MMDSERPDPESLLKAIQKEEQSTHRGKLKIFFGMSAGVGKTYAMLEAAQKYLKDGGDVVVGLVDTHSRVETELLTKGLPIVPEKVINYKGASFKELDLDAILKRKPKLVLVDELAHTNVPGSRHPKRWQDVLEILDAGINVYTTVNVQHIESRKDIVEGITEISIRETVPDNILEMASEIELVDIPPSELLKRLQEGKVYLGEQPRLAIQNFFKEDRLTALREIALRITAEKVDHELQGMISASEYGGWKPTERLLVAVDQTPDARILIRTTRRLAFSLNATWLALHVDDGSVLNEEEKAQLSNNLELARSLGAEVITTSDPDICRAIGRTASLKHVTQIVMGQTKRKFFKEIIEGGSFINRLIAEVGDIDIHIIKQKIKTVYMKRMWKNFRFPSHFSYYWATLLFIFILTGINLLLNPYIGYKSVGLVYLLGILVISLFTGKGPIFLAALLSAGLWDVLFIPPYGKIAVNKTEDFEFFLVYIFAALITGILTHRIREREFLMKVREERAEALYQISDAIVKAPDRDKMIDSVTQRLGSLLNGDCHIVYKEEGEALSFKSKDGILSDEKEKAVAEWVFSNGKIAGWSTDTLPSASAFYVPLQGFKEIVGVLAYRPKNVQSFSIEERSLLYTVSQQVAIYLERSLLKERARKAAFLHQVENIQQAILDSVSNEFRTPMSAIIGAARAMENDDVIHNKNVRHQYLHQLHSSVESLNRIIDNFLDMSRLSSGFLTLQESTHQIEEVIESVIDSLQHHLVKHQIKITIPKGLPSLTFDFPLMEIVFTNLILNAAEYSPPDTLIEIDAKGENGRLSISVADQGPGIPAEEVTRIFDKFYRILGTQQFGSGLGLSIAKAIVEIHEGKIEARNRTEGGSEFIVTLPVRKS